MREDSAKISGNVVLGATGRIGTLLRKAWGADGAQAGGPNPGPASDPVRWIGRYKPDDAQGDWAICDPLKAPEALTDALAGRAVILCLAGPVPHPDLPDSALEAHAALACATVQAAPRGARVLLASSAAVYGNHPGTLTETTQPAPIHPYGQAKLDAEHQARDLAQKRGVRLSALRIGNIAGLDAILGGWKPGFQLDRFANGRTPARSYIGPGLLAQVLGELMGRDDLPDTLNIAAPGTVEMGALLDAAGLDWTPRPAPDSAIPEVQLCTRRLETITPLPADAGHADQLVRDWQNHR